MPYSIRNIAKATLWLVAGLFGLAALVVAVLLLRLSAGPIDVSFLDSRIESLVADLPGGNSITLEDVVLEWDRKDNNIALQGRQIQILNRDRTVVATLPTINVSLSVPALLRGSVALSGFEIDEADVHLIRDVNGVRLFSDESLPGEMTPGPRAIPTTDDLMPFLTQVFDQLEAEPDPSRPLSYLTHIAIDGELTADDRVTGWTWGAPKVHFEMHHRSSRVEGKLEVALSSPTPLRGIEADVSYKLADRGIELEASFSGVQPSRMSALTPALKVLSGVDVSLNGKLSGLLRLPDQFEGFSFAIASSAGTVSVPDYFTHEVTGISAQGHFNVKNRTVELKKATVHFGTKNVPGPTLDAKATLAQDKGHTKIGVQAGLSGLKIDDLNSYWPGGVAEAARDWLVENIRDGTARKATVDLQLTVPPEGDASVALDELKGTLEYQDLSVSFLRPLPPLRGVNGTGRFDRHGFYLQAADASLRGIALTDAKVDITGLDEDELAIAIDAHVNGPIGTVLELLSQPPLSLTEIGISPAATGGEVDADLSIVLPLKAELSFGDVDINVNGKLRNASLNDLYKDHGVDHGELSLSLDPASLALDGRLEFAGIPVEVSSKTSFGNETEARLSIPKIRQSDLTRLGLPIEEYLGDDLSMKLHARIGQDRGTVDITADLTEARLSFALLDWNKPAGKTAHAALTVETIGTRVSGVTGIDVQADTLTVKGSVGFDPTGDFRRLDLDTVSAGDSHLRNVVLEVTDQLMDVTVGGGVFDAAPLMKRDTVETGRSPGSSKPTTDGAPQPQDRNLHIQINELDKVLFAEDRQLERIKADLTRGAAGWEAISISAQVPDSRDSSLLEPTDTHVPGVDHMSVVYGPATDGQYPLQVDVDDLGSVLRALALFENLTGGRLTITGKGEGPVPGAVLKGTLSLDRFSIKNLPALAQILNAASLDQLFSSLKGNGLQFKAFHGDFEFSEGVVKSDLFRAYGGSVGLTLKGEVDTGDRNLKLSGVVVPLYRISKVLDKIPVLNKILVGGKGEGLIAMNYSVEGPFENPQASVQPGSLLTPGFLRNLVSKEEKQRLGSDGTE